MRTLVFGLIILSIACIQSCDSTGTLARRIAGAWTASPEKLNMPETTASDATVTYDFVLEKGQNGGTVTVTALLTVSRPVSPVASETPVTPIQVSASGAATIQGTWKAVDDDEVFVILDPSTVTVSVDPQGVTFGNYNPDTASYPALETFRAGATELLKQEMTTAVERRFLTTHHLDDIEIHDGLMLWEVGGIQYRLTRQN